MSDEIQPIIIGPPTGTTEAVMRAIEHAMHHQVGIPIYMVEDQLPSSVDLRSVLPPPYDYIKDLKLLEDEWKCQGPTLSIRVQAEIMGMKIINNRKRMRKRVRQRRRHFDPYEEHWTNNPNGDW